MRPNLFIRLTALALAPILIATDLRYSILDIRYSMPFAITSEALVQRPAAAWPANGHSRSVLTKFVHDALVPSQKKQRLGHRFYGPADGYPIVYFSGILSCVMVPILPQEELEALLSEIGIRLIAIDRFGIGESERMRGFTPLDFRNAVEELLGVILPKQKFTLMGSSAGGFFAQFCRDLPGLEQMALISSFAPLTFPSIVFLHPLHVIKIFTARYWRSGFIRKLEKERKITEQKLAADEDSTSDKQGHRRRLAALVNLERAADEVAALANARWISFRRFSVPVQIWHGKKDTDVHWLVSRLLARLIPHVKLHLLENADHYILRDREQLKHVLVSLKMAA